MTHICRIIHFENLPSLLEWGCDWSPNQAKAKGLIKKPIHHKDIMDKREHTLIRVPPGGFVADYVPFYFGPKSPMLYAIKQGKVAGYQGQREIIYLVACAEDIQERQLPFVFTDGHAIITYINHFNQLKDLDKLNWNAIHAQYWNDLLDGKCRRQAEFLVKDCFPMGCVQEVGVMDTTMLKAVKAEFEKSTFKPLIRERPEWYF